MLKNDRYLENLSDLGQYPIQNAWFDVCFGGCPYGVFSAACPIEPLHSLEKGLINDVLIELFDEKLTTGTRAVLDSYAQSLWKLPRQRYLNGGTTKDMMPRLLWKDGICSLTDLTAGDRVGIMLTVFVISLTDTGKLFLENQFGSKTIVRNMKTVFVKLLCYWSWLKNPHIGNVMITKLWNMCNMLSLIC